MTRLNYIFLALSAICLISCNKEKPSSEFDSGEAPEPILVRAGGASGGLSKNMIINDYEELIASGKPLSLYAYLKHSGLDDAKSVMSNVKLSYDGAGWTYSPLQYWLNSADEYGFFASFPYIQGRLDPIFHYPTPSDEYIVGVSGYEKLYPLYETWAAEDYAQGNIIRKESKSLYLTNATEDVMFGGSIVQPASFGNQVHLPIGHACAAVRFRVRNLSEHPFALTNWYLTGLKNHVDMSLHIIDCPEEYDPMRFMTVVADDEIDTLSISSFGEFGVVDKFKRAGSPDWIICAEGGDVPGGENYYKYVMLSSRLKELGSSYNLSHIHSTDGKTITYYDGTGNSWTDPKAFMNESTVYKAAVAAVRALYADVFPIYSKNIFWGPAHYLDADQFFMPIVYERGASIIDLNADRKRGDAGDYALKIHQFECRSHMFKKSEGVWKANGGLYLPVHAENCAILYSPYFFNAENHTSIAGDWKEGMAASRWNDSDPNYNNNEGGKQRSIFLWTANNSSPSTPLLVDDCIRNLNEGLGAYSPSVLGGDLANVLNDWGYILMFPQTIDNLEFNFYTAPDVSGTGAPSTASYNQAPAYHNFSVKKYTPGGEWLAGYTYDYIITVSTSSISMTVDVEPWNERNIDLK